MIYTVEMHGWSKPGRWHSKPDIQVEVEVEVPGPDDPVGQMPEGQSARATALTITQEYAQGIHGYPGGGAILTIVSAREGAM